MKKKNSKVQIKKSFAQFKKIVTQKLGRIHWGKVGIYSLALLLFVALKGFLGIEAQILAIQIVRLSNFV